MSASDAGWKPDPAGRHQYRYWDGTAWTDQVSDDGAISSDPMDASATSAPTAATGPAGFAAASAPPPGATGAPGRGAGSKVPLIVGGVVLVALIAAAAFFLTRDDDVDGADLAEAFREQGMPAEQADCYARELDGVFTESRIRALDEGAEPTDEESAALFGAIGECGIEGLNELEGGLEDGTGYGDNAGLDALWDACEGGDMESCDELYMTSEFGSEYEEFGSTCGGRSDEETYGGCAD